MNGEDAEYLSRHELSEKYGGPSRDTLISLDPYTCYARIMREDGKLSRPFFFRTASPLIPDPDICIDVLDMRDEYARKRNEAVAEALAYLSRIEKYRFYSSGQITDMGSDGGSSKLPEKRISVPDKNDKKEDRLIKDLSYFSKLKLVIFNQCFIYSCIVKAIVFFIFEIIYSFFN